MLLYFLYRTKLICRCESFHYQRSSISRFKFEIQRISKSVFSKCLVPRCVKMWIFNFFSIYQNTSFSRFSTLVQFHWDKIHLKMTLPEDPRPCERTSTISVDFLRDFQGPCKKSSVSRRTWGLSPAIVSDDSSSILPRTRCTWCYLSLRHSPRHRGSISNQLITLHVCVTTTVPLFVWKQTQPSTRRDAQAVKFDVGISALEPRQLIKVFLLYQGFFEISSTFSFLYVWKDKRKLLINKLLFKDWKTLLNPMFPVVLNYDNFFITLGFLQNFSLFFTFFRIFKMIFTL